MYMYLTHLKLIQRRRIGGNINNFFSLLLKDFGPEDETGAMTK